MNVLSKNAIQILKERYLLKDLNGEVLETPTKMFRRVANFVANGELDNHDVWLERFFSLMNDLHFLPNSPTLMNAGLPDGQLSACFVLPVEDSLESIFTTLKNAALVHQSGGGTGFNFSHLRPKNDPVSGLGGTSSGPLAFMKIYDAATEYVKQGGKRRGANMGILRIDHPDIEEFIKSKSDKKTLNNFNISVGITDAFMEAVMNDTDWDLVNPRNEKVVQTIKAVKLWKLIVNEAWKTGDPGLIFLDAINEKNPTPGLGKIECTNPCGEVPLLPYESCNLGSVNLSKMLKKVGGKFEIDWDKLKKTIHLSVRFLDNIITINHYLLPEIKDITTSNRKIGLGVMGWAEMLLLLQIPYASDAAVTLAEKLMKFIHEESYKASQKLATERGAFPEWIRSIYNGKMELRNATCNSIAPTGTISVIANTSYSIEPLFGLAFNRIGILGDKTQTEINSIFINKLKELGIWDARIKKEIIKTGSINNISNIPQEIKMLFQTSLEIPWEYHLLHQKAFQKYTDNAVSKTINLPESATVEDISNIYFKAWEYRLKGITIYRDGSKDNQVLQKCNLGLSTSC